MPALKMLLYLVLYLFGVCFMWVNHAWIFFPPLGVLLLNSVLTVRAHQPTSHEGQGWELFTDAVVQWLSSNLNGLVFLLWGSYAQRKGKVIDRVSWFMKCNCTVFGQEWLWVWHSNLQEMWLAVFRNVITSLRLHIHHRTRHIWASLDADTSLKQICYFENQEKSQLIGQPFDRASFFLKPCQGS